MQPLAAIGSRIGQATRSGVASLYRRSRPQYHSALFVLLFSAFLLAMWVALLAVLSPLFGLSLSIDWSLVFLFIGGVAVGELARGHVTALLGETPEWRVWVAMAVSACVAAAALMTPICLMWGWPPLAEGLILFGGIALGYVVMLWILRFERRRHLHTKP